MLMGPFYLTQKLLPALKKSAEISNAPAKVIHMLSGGLYTQGIHIDDLNFNKGHYSGEKAYARAKRGLLDISEFLSREISQNEVVFHSLHPGWVKTPGLTKGLPGFEKRLNAVLRTPFQGADTAIWLALDRTAESSSGAFWLDRKTHTTQVFPRTASDIVKQSRLYEVLCERIHRQLSKGSEDDKTAIPTATATENE